MAVPALVMNGDDDQVVPIASAAETAMWHLPGGTLSAALLHGVPVADQAPSARSQLDQAIGQVDAIMPSLGEI